MNLVKFLKVPDIFNAEINLPASKSISNRVLIIKALCDKKFNINNLSEADDTALMTKALESNGPIINVKNAGTAMRFLTAYYAQSSKTIFLEGSSRMNERPIAPLVSAFQTLGADIKHMGKDGFPPLNITGTKLKGGNIKVVSSISSQFISALMLIAPKMDYGLNIEFDSIPVSLPYIKMTGKIMEVFGAKNRITPNCIYIEADKYNASDFEVENDWSSASYFYAMAAIKPGSTIKFSKLYYNSVQGDSVISKFMEEFGVITTYNNNNVEITSGNQNISHFSADLIDHPDLIPTIVCLCSALKIPFKIEGARTLKHKESQRADTLKDELKKLGIDLTLTDNSIKCDSYPMKVVDNTTLLTYNDHRLVMSFSILALAYPTIMIENPTEVQKSFPGFFDELSRLEIKTEVTQ
jgi:3-phosphoshikimate 1-carboxyvinyltransferase